MILLKIIIKPFNYSDSIIYFLSIFIAQYYFYTNKRKKYYLQKSNNILNKFRRFNIYSSKNENLNYLNKLFFDNPKIRMH